MIGGGGGIRTHGAYRTRDFQSRPLGLYGTPPGDRPPKAEEASTASALGVLAIWLSARRKGWDSNPRRLVTLPHFEGGSFNRSDTLPPVSISQPPLPCNAARPESQGLFIIAPA